VADREKFELEVANITAEARDVLLVELRSPEGSPLPAFEPGAHLEIDLPNGLIRHYSLTNDARERDRYVVGVGRAANGRGGSEFIHQRLRCGARLKASLRNNFRLADGAARYLFIAGGIGITPIMAMIRWCETNARPWRLAYAVRSVQRAAFGETLRAFGERAHLHFDDERGAVLDARPWLARAGDGEHVYCCGPGPLMAAVKTHSEHWPQTSVHFEYFTPPADAPAAQSGAFKVVLRKSNRSLLVPADKSILETLEDNGMMVPFSCREGMCGTCETAVCAGEIEHRDYVLTEEQRQAGQSMMLCVSRARSEELVLAL
jgi:vanillate O-demethylase ferredoxin subunit